jgi:drug/metabolite transporter (DMT)-like permease
VEILNIGVLVTAVGVLVIVTNALTEVFKGIFKKIPAQITATVIALFLTVSAVLAYLTITQTPIEWYMIVGAIVAGFFVSYTAQFGYDKLMEIIELIGGKNDI